MGDRSFAYRSFVDVMDLQLGECTIHRAVDGSGQKRYWNLWFKDNRDSDGQTETFCVPVNPNGGWQDPGACGDKTWGLEHDGALWHVTPSVNVLGSRQCHPGEHETEPSLWHHWIDITAVGDAETWATGGPP